MSQDDNDRREPTDTDVVPAMSEAEREAETKPRASERPLRDTKPPDEEDFRAERALRTMLPQVPRAPRAATLDQDTDSMEAKANDDLISIHRDVKRGLKELLDPGGRLDLQTRAISAVVDQAVAKLEQATAKIDGNHQLLAGQLQSLSKASAEKDVEHDRRLEAIERQMVDFRTRLEALERSVEQSRVTSQQLSELKAMITTLQGQAAAPLLGRTVLAVEDEKTLLRWFSRALESGGATVLAAHGFDEAKRALESARADCALLDIGLDGTNGFDVAQWLISEKWINASRILLVTGNASPQDRERARSLGLAIILEKPIQAAALVSAVVASLEKPT